MATSLLVPITPPAVPIPGLDLVYVERSTSVTGPWERIGQASLIDGVGFYYDNTAPFDVPVFYQFLYVASDGSAIEGGGDDVGPLTLVGNGSVVLSDPLRPWADLEFFFCETPQTVTSVLCAPVGPDLAWVRFGDRVRDSDAGLFPILDAERPADVYARRKDHGGTIAFFTRTLAAIELVYELFTVGGPLYLRAPAAYGETDFHIQPGALAESFLSARIDQRKPFRLWTAPYMVVDRPLGPQQGTACANWCAVKDAFPTFADLTATGDTWADVAAGTTVCP